MYNAYHVEALRVALHLRHLGLRKGCCLHRHKNFLKQKIDQIQVVQQRHKLLDCIKKRNKYYYQISQHLISLFLHRQLNLTLAVQCRLR